MNNVTESLSNVLERGRLARKLAKIAFVLAFALALTIFLAGPVYGWSGIGLFNVMLIPFVLAAVFSLVAAVRAAFFVKFVTEEEEKALLKKRKENVASLLDVSEDVRFTAQRTLENFDKYVPSSVTVLCFLLTGWALFYFWKNSVFGGGEAFLLNVLAPKDPVSLAFLSAVIACAGFFLGVFLIGQSHVKEFRVLRAAGSWLVAGSAVALLCALSAILIANGKTGYDVVFEKIVFGILCILCVEFLVCFVVEFYRPRVDGETRPVYESRLLALFTEPGGVMRNVADSLDYQFGFQVSKMGIYSFLMRSIVPALLLWFFVFWLFTGIAEVSPGEVGIRERFGAVPEDKALLSPGVHLKLPWPMEKIVRVPVGRVNSVTIGSTIDPEKFNAEAAKVVLWTGLTHYLTEDQFLVAADRKVADGKLSFPVSLLEVSLPVFYQADAARAYDYAFNYENVDAALLSIGRAAATKYFASTDFMKDISYGRGEVASALKAIIQKACDEQSLGINVISVNMHDAHPPVAKQQNESARGEDAQDVAGAFQKVVCAQEEAKTLVSAAKAYESRTLEAAKVEKMNIISGAEAYKYEVTHVASAVAGRFEQQLASFRAMPSMFRLRTYLFFLENECRELRKFVVSSKIKSRIYEVNLEEKPRLDLLDTDLDDLGK